jgi:glucose-1-phosphate thymidylyltransferase
VKGVVLAGGLGTRLHPLTKVTNKHLLPVYDRPMVYFPIETLVEAGITDILVVTGGNNAGDFLKLLGNGKQFGLTHINYTYQEGEGGIAEALSLAEAFAEGRCHPGGQYHRRIHHQRCFGFPEATGGREDFSQACT